MLLLYLKRHIMPCENLSEDSIAGLMVGCLAWGETVLGLGSERPSSDGSTSLDSKTTVKLLPAVPFKGYIFVQYPRYFI